MISIPSTVLTKTPLIQKFASSLNLGYCFLSEFGDSISPGPSAGTECDTQNITRYEKFQKKWGDVRLSALALAVEM